MDNVRKNVVGEYFNSSKLANDVFFKKYSYKGESPAETLLRLTNAIVENSSTWKRKFKRAKTKNLSDYGKLKVEKYKEAIKNKCFESAVFNETFSLLNGFDKLILGGSVISTLGTDQPLSLSNCFVIDSPDDSLIGINKSINEMENIFARRGGVGIDLSTVRPRGAKINNAARESEGVVSLMKHKYAESTKYIAQNGRRGALMLMYDCRGCDIEDFINCKQDDTSITTANISVKMHDDFMYAVKNKKPYILRFPVDEFFDDEEENKLNEILDYDELTSIYLHGKYVYVKKVDAKRIWDSLVKCAWNKAEPGILFWDRIKNYDPASLYDNLSPIATNPCGEQPLAAYDTCRLLSYNLSSFVKNPFEEDAHIDFDEVYKAFYDTQYIADTIVDLECEYVAGIRNYVEDKSIKEMWEKVIDVARGGRRTGVGFTGLADMLAKLNKNYELSPMLVTLFRTILTAQIDASVDLALIKGTFENYDKEKTNKCQWTREIEENDIVPKETIERLKKHGMRNVSLNTCAPTGSTSILAGCTSGIEPLFLPYYRRKVKVNEPNGKYDEKDAEGNKFVVYNVVHPGLVEFINKKNPSEDIESMSEEKLKEYFQMSPYFNNCAQDLEGMKRVDIQGFIQKYITSSISSTVNLKNDASVEYVESLLLRAWESCKGITIYRDGCRDGVMNSLDSKQETNNKILKRPKSIPCDVIRFSNNNEKWIAFVGKVDNSPYEIFTGLLSKLEIPKDVEKGNIVKIKSSNGSSYNFEYINNDGSKKTIESINTVFNSEFWNYGKLLSGLLRHNMPIVYIIKTLQGMTFNNETINSWRNGVVRSLKKWIKDGTESSEKCPECGSVLIFENGCKRCPNCGYSACG